MLRRRHFLHAGCSGAALLTLGACGFELRRAVALPYRRVALQGFAARSPLAAALRQALEGQAEVVDAPAPADIVVAAMLEQNQRVIVASTSAGQVRELQLRVRFTYRVLGAEGREKTPATELMLVRDMTYNESAALAKALEEEQLVREMQTDIAQQVVRRLASLPR